MNETKALFLSELFDAVTNLFSFSKPNRAPAKKTVRRLPADLGSRQKRDFTPLLQADDEIPNKPYGIH